MGKNYFTNEQQNELRDNIYVKNVSEKTITYTEDFRKKFAMIYQSGVLPSVILVEMGFDPIVLGKKRQSGIVERIKNNIDRPQGFKDTREHNSGRPITRDLSDAEKMKRLEQKIEYLKQENEFLKKNIQLENQTILAYNRKHLKNSKSLKK